MPGRRFLKRRRGAARTALYASLVLTGLVALAFYPLFRRTLAMALDQSWFDVDWESRDDVRVLQGLVRIDTTAETGSELEAARYIADVLADTGAEIHIESLPGSKANVWAILEGSDPDALVLHSHLDTDPIVHPDRWTDSPFSGAIQPPWIFGRGTFDMKSVTAAQIQAFKALARDMAAGKLELPRSVVLLATSSEETGSELGTRRIVSEHPELTQRFWAVLTEGGVVEAVERHHVKYWGTEFAQKYFVPLLARSPSREPLDELLQLLEEREPDGPLHLAPEVETFLAAYAPSRDFDWLVTLLSDPAALVSDPARFAYLPDYLKALFRNEIHGLTPHPTSGGYESRIFLHLVPGSDLEEARTALVPKDIPDGITLDMEILPAADHGSPVDHPAFRAIERTLDTRSDVVHHGPYFLSYYATDARFFRYAGIPAYGFSPFIVLSTDTFTITGPNERLALPAFADGVALYEQIVRAIVDAGSEK